MKQKLLNTKQALFFNWEKVYHLYLDKPWSECERHIISKLTPKAKRIIKTQYLDSIRPNKGKLSNEGLILYKRWYRNPITYPEYFIDEANYLRYYKGLVRHKKRKEITFAYWCTLTNGYKCKIVNKQEVYIYNLLVKSHLELSIKDNKIELDEFNKPIITQLYTYAPVKVLFSSIRKLLKKSDYINLQAHLYGKSTYISNNNINKDYINKKLL